MMKERAKAALGLFIVFAWIGFGVVIVMGVVGHLEYKRAQANEVAQIMEE